MRITGALMKESLNKGSILDLRNAANQRERAFLSLDWFTVITGQHMTFRGQITEHKTSHEPKSLWTST